MDRHAFLNRLKALSFIDGHQLPELTDVEQRVFIGNPVWFFIRANDAHAAAIWREVEKSQRKDESDLLRAAKALDAWDPTESTVNPGDLRKLMGNLHAAIARVEAR